MKDIPHEYRACVDGALAAWMTSTTLEDSPAANSLTRSGAMPTAVDGLDWGAKVCCLPETKDRPAGAARAAAPSTTALAPQTSDFEASWVLSVGPSPSPGGFCSGPGEVALLGEMHKGDQLAICVRTRRPRAAPVAPLWRTTYDSGVRLAMRTDRRRASRNVPRPS